MGLSCATTQRPLRSGRQVCYPLYDDPHRQVALDGSGAARQAGRHMVRTGVGPRPIRASHGASRQPHVRGIFAACAASI